MASPFTAPPAGTEVPPSSDARYFYRRQAFSRNPVTGGNWQPGKSVNFVAEASGGHYLVPSECRLVARLLVKDSTGKQLEQSVRFATDPIHCGLFNAGMLSINGTTVESVASNMRDQSLLQLRMDRPSFQTILSDYPFVCYAVSLAVCAALLCCSPARPPALFLCCRPRVLPSCAHSVHPTDLLCFAVTFT